MSGKTIESPEWLLDADWSLENANGRDYLLASKAGLTFTFCPVFQSGRTAHSFQYLDHRLPAEASLRDIEDQDVLDVVRKGWEAAWRERDQEAEAKRAAYAARPLGMEDILSAVNSAGTARLIRVVVALTSNPDVYRAIPPERFDLARLKPGWAPAGVISLGRDFDGYRIARTPFRATDETWATRALRAAERAGILKSNRRNRTELESIVKNGSYFD